MISTEITNLDVFIEVLTVTGKFVNQLQFIIDREKTTIFCKNQQDFPTSRMYMYTNSLRLEKDSPVDKIKYNLKDVTGLKSALNIVKSVENRNTVILNFEEFEDNGEYYAKFLQYDGTAKFKLISVNTAVIDKYISADLRPEIQDQITKDLCFDINPVYLDILQNKTGNIVDISNEVSIYICPDKNTKKIMVDLNVHKVDLSNSFSLPISDSYTGEFESGISEVAVHESAFRLFNMLRVKNPIPCFFVNKFNSFFINSEIEKDGIYIRLKVINQIIKGK